MNMAETLIFFVNGKKITDNDADPEMTLLTYLRNKIHLTGTKLGCGEGGCGACTVMVSKWDKVKCQVTHISVNACLAPLVSMHMCAVTTVEGIGSTKTKIHQVQKRLAEFHGSQCGFCTPGIIMSMYTLLRNNPEPDKKELDDYLQGNLCRCTGYRPIIAAFQTFTKEGCPMGKNCCKINGKATEEPIENGTNGVYGMFDPSQEPIFPPELMIKSKEEVKHSTILFTGERSTWFVPSTMEEMLKLRQQYPLSRIVGGNTEVGIETTIKGFHYSHFISPANVREMSVINVTDEGMEIGAACTLTQIRKSIKELLKQQTDDTVQIHRSLLEMLHWFAGEQIRNVAVIGGNIMTSSPISDINPILTAAGATMTFQKFQNGSISSRKIEMDSSFFVGYRKTSNHPDEILTSIFIPFTTRNDIFRAYKQSKRRDDDIAIVNAGFHVRFQEGTDIVDHLSIAYGGVAATTKVPYTILQKSKTRQWNQNLLEDVGSWLAEDLQIPGNAPGGMVEYRRTLVQSLFFKFYMEVVQSLHEMGRAQNVVDPTYASAIKPNSDYDELLVAATQTWEDNTDGQPKTDSVGRPVLHASALKQVTGEARYIDDMPRMEGELYLALVTSTEAHAKIINVDISEAEKSPGFVTYVDHNDVPGKNTVWINETVMAYDTVTCIGQVIGCVVADTSAHAQRAAKLVKIKYEKIEPCIVAVEDAVAKKSFYKDSLKQICKGNPEEEFKNCDHVIEGEVRSNAQEHFYLETHACIAIPKNEDGEMEVFSSTQNATLTQTAIADVLGIDRNKVHVRVKRIGGGFGGKETRSILVSNAVALAANKCNKPVRCMLTRQEDMVITGTRHTFYSKYKVGFNQSGKVKAVSVEFYCNAGNTADLSVSVNAKALLMGINCYNVPNVRHRGAACKTNIASNTAFRGFGAPQGMFVAETWITHVAETLGMDPQKIRDLNIWHEGDITPYNQVIDSPSVIDCWENCLAKTNLQERKAAVEKFNKQNRWKKRGLACVPTTYGIVYQYFLDQGGALVNVYTDGSVLISHGGMEMGQGLHTKMIQVASRALGVDASQIHISETSTNVVPNTSASAASLSSDLYGMAVKNACEKINSNIETIKKQNPNFSWKEIVNEAYMQRIQLSATGFYATPDIEHTWDLKSGEIAGRYFNYYTSGAAVSEVEVDCLTGDHVVLQTDIVMDLGRSLNPAIDIGQIEGAFTQGYGLFTLEDPLYSPTGKLWTVGPGAYKIPGFGDIPKRFNVHLLPASENKRAIYSSKAVGEPPLFLASSVFFAIRDAVKSARLDNNIKGYFRFDSPASAENIRMSCGDEFVESSKRDEDKESTPWAIRS